MQRDELLQQWCTGVRISHVAHEKAAARYDKIGRLLGVTVVILSTIVGTAIFATMAESPSTLLRVVTGVLSTTAAVVAAVQAFLNYPQRTADHREAAMRFGTLRRRLEQFIAFPPADGLALAKAMGEFAQEWDDVDSAAPSLPQPIYDRAKRYVEGRQEREREARSVQEARPAPA
ncbi:MAG: SLATT domain-containing protein [Actinomycetota bacterium]|nr:SLATT domain-containing protein [Actinomycetota bacterium]